MQNSTAREFHTSKRVKREVKLIEPLRVKKNEDTFKPRVALTKMQRQLLWCQYYSAALLTVAKGASTVPAAESLPEGET